MPDRERYNVLYTPELTPERNYRSEAIFDKTPPLTPPVDTYVPPEDIPELILDLLELEGLVPSLPEGLEPVGEIVTYLRQRAQIILQEQEIIKEIETILPPPIKRGTPEYHPTNPKWTSTPTTTYAPPTIVPTTKYIPPTAFSSTGVTRTYKPTSRIVIGGSGEPTTTYVSDTPGIAVIPNEWEYDDGYTYTGLEEESIPGSTFSPEDKVGVYIGSNIIEEEYEIPGLPSLFPEPTNIVLEVTTPKTLVEIAQETYKKDQIDLQKYYVEKMRSALQKYFQHQLAVMAELGIGDIDLLTQSYDGENVTVSDNNYRHLHDTIIRSQLQRKQKSMFFKKVANTDQTLTHMRTWNAAEKEKEHYYDEAYGDSTNFIDSESNSLLRQARSDYEAAYNNGLYNMFRYLDSSVQITEDILDHTIIESKAKAKLLKEGVNIFKTVEYTTQGTDTSVSTTQPKTKEQAEAEKKLQQQDSDTATSQLTPEDYTEAMGIEDPATDCSIAPYGGYYSEKDIQNVITANPQIADSENPREQAANILSLQPKYQKVETTSSDTATSEITTDTAATSTTTESQSDTTTTTSSSIVEQQSKEGVGKVTGQDNKEKAETVTDSDLPPLTTDYSKWNPNNPTTIIMH